MMPLVVLRPQPGCDATVAAARAVGLPADGFPLFAVVPLLWDAPAPGSFDALLIGSANALRHGSAGLSAYRGKPAYVVGASTARAAGAAGLTLAAVGEGGLQRVLDRVLPEHRRLLRLAGRERLPLEPPPGTAIDERIVYASEPLPMPPALAERLREPALVMLHSAEAARYFAALCESSGIDRAAVTLAAIGPRVVAAAGDGWRAAASAATPDDEALLALAQRMCQEGRGQGRLQDTA